MILRVCLFFVPTLLLFADVTVPQTVYNGKTFTLLVPQKKSCKVQYLGKVNYPLFKKDEKLFFILSTPYRAKLQKETITVKCEGFVYETEVSVQEGEYKKEQITVSKKIFEQDEKTKHRISSEYSEAKKIYATFGDTLYLDGPFSIPLESVITSYFGNKRLFNGAFKSYHSGVDFRAKIGTAIQATNSGKVVLAKDRYYAGKSVVVDHGQGIYSCYFHLSQIDVKVGQFVKKGELLGLSGKSGRVSGPHLHYGFIIGGNNVDPLEAMEVLNSTLF